jgi:hypothetical protein
LGKIHGYEDIAERLFVICNRILPTLVLTYTSILDHFINKELDLESIEFIYLALAIIFGIVLIRQANDKLFLGVLLIWLLGYPILNNPNYMIHLPGLGFDLQPNRILLLSLIIVLIREYLKKRSSSIRNTNISKRKASLPYEKWIFSYIIIVAITEFINVENIGLRNVIASVSNFSIFLIIYYLSKWLISPKDFYLLTRAIFFIAIISSIVSVIQFNINPDFFRIGSERGAFGEFTRANGLFNQEYNHGFFQIVTLAIGLSVLRGKVSRILIILITGIAVFFTMHRATWIIWITSLVIFTFQYTKNHLRSAILISIILLLSIISGYISLDYLFSHNQFFIALNQRIYEQTIDIRMEYNRFALNLVSKKPFGVGDYQSSDYTKEALLAGMPLQRSSDTGQMQPLIVHNGILASGVKYGYLGMLAFLLMALSPIIYYFKITFINKTPFLLPLVISLIFLFYNITQDFSNLGYQIQIFFGMLLGFFSATTIKNSIATHKVKNNT